MPLAGSPPVPATLEPPPTPPFAPTDEAASDAPLNHVSPPAVPADPADPTWTVSVPLSPARLDTFEYPPPPPPDPAKLKSALHPPAPAPPVSLLLSAQVPSADTM